MTTDKHEASRGLSATAELLVNQYQRVTDERTDGRTDTSPIATSRIAERDNKRDFICIYFHCHCSFMLGAILVIDRL